MAVGTVQTRQMGWALRIYKNSTDKILAIDDISVITNIRRITTDRFHHSANFRSKRMLMNLASGGRVVAKVQMMGDYNSITTDSGDYLSATWDAASVNENAVTMSFDALAKIGDTL